MDYGILFFLHSQWNYYKCSGTKACWITIMDYEFFDTGFDSGFLEVLDK
jgi:hypothetical protein